MEVPSCRDTLAHFCADIRTTSFSAGTIDSLYLPLQTIARFYLENLREQCELLDLSLFSYCLMTNHVHLLVQPERAGEDISRLMRVLAARQTRYTNRLES